MNGKGRTNGGKEKMNEKESETHIAIFNGKSIRRKLVDVRKIRDFPEHPENPNQTQGFLEDRWFFSVVDIVGVLTESTIPRRYWSDLKIKLKEEGFESYDKIVQLKLKSGDGKEYETDCADTESIFRIIQSIPSKKAEPFKRWLARVGYLRNLHEFRFLMAQKFQTNTQEFFGERIQEIENPELAQERMKKLLAGVSN